MARDISLIENQILDNVAADPVLAPQLTSTSKRAIYRLWAFITATVIAMLEQLIDLFETQVEAVAAHAAPSTASWLQNQIFLFQFSSTNPQVIQFVNFAPVYPFVDTTLQIITRCSVTTSLSNRVLIKVAKGNPPGPLSSPEIAALSAYLNPPNGLGVAGIQYSISSKNADQIYIAAEIFYAGQFSSVIKNNVIAAINAYLAAIPFNGQLKISDLELAIKQVAGVNDVVLQDVVARPDATGYGGGSQLVTGEETMSRLYNSDAGYIISEQTVTHTLADSLIFTSE